MAKKDDRTTHYQEGSLTLPGTVMLGTGVMIGAGIFALTGQMAQMTGVLFPLAFLAAAVVVGFSAYSYIKISNTWPSAGGIGMYLHKAYGNRLPTAFNALLMYFSMVIAQSFLARTFGAYTMQLFGSGEGGIMVPVLGVLLILAAFVINLSSNRLIQGVASFVGILKIIGILIFGLVGIWVADSISVDFSNPGEAGTFGNFLGATALGILAFKGFTTITNSGSEVKDPKRNVGRAIVISIVSCVVIYTLVGFAVASNLSLAEIIRTQNYSLAAAARPALGEYGVWATVAIAMMATAGGILASIFAVSRMLAMLTEMKLVPHSHFGMPGSIQKHTLVYTVVLGLFLTAFFDLSRIAALGIVFYLIMDIAIHWGVLRYLREELNAKAWIPVTAIVLDLLVLGGFVWVKLNTDPFVIGVAVVAMIVIAVGEQIFLKKSSGIEPPTGEHSHAHHH
ncbi:MULTISPECIES: APC family permease [Alcanivorax]|jgi:amino acid transporter|uniref:Amino acid transporter n=1 Tax=Alcanivorax hongdengensis A-11-3 TaxID=1177179 RepID=L0W8B5_9GAMM|nr:MULTISPECIES: APC family permease [Alcanivorax]EKF73209.1 amino acid transporter [Alcanivorax hongdengensis A-11-3]MDF1638260.1 APC family permease [Alcanivorax jadensis]|tara:strand:- start:2042 stop:3394 length:1353 start_codon:yes stop_codon:yes gene_type:complete